MEYKKLDPARYLLRLDPGDEILASLAAFQKAEGVRLAMVQGLGAVNRVVMGVYDVAKQEYKASTMEGAFEMLSLTGTLDSKDGAPYSHFHIVVGDEQGGAYGGHLNEGRISATAELVITCLPGEVDREKSAKTGLNIWKF